MSKLFPTRNPFYPLLFIGLIISLSFMLLILTKKTPVRTKKLPQAAIQLDTLSIDQKANLTNDQWKQLLPRNQYEVLRLAATETPFTGEYLQNKQKGTYVTADCGEPVFHSDQKYDSGTGWPSFTAPINEDAIELHEDNTNGQQRVEVRSKKCRSHLGHVFDDGPAPTGKRFCINSLALKFIPDTL